MGRYKWSDIPMDIYRNFLWPRELFIVHAIERKLWLIVHFRSLITNPWTLKLLSCPLLYCSLCLIISFKLYMTVYFPASFYIIKGYIHDHINCFIWYVVIPFPPIDQRQIYFCCISLTFIWQITFVFFLNQKSVWISSLTGKFHAIKKNIF
jgi:hypothetical protein